MKKLLGIILAGTSIGAFADGFQDFNNNAYLQLNDTFINQGQGGTTNGYTLGATIQSKNNIWINAEAYGSPYNSNTQTLAGTTPALGGSAYGQFLATAKAGYAFQFFKTNTSGFQIIPYATFTYGTSLGALNQYYGAGVKPEYRLGSALKVSFDATAYAATQDGGSGPSAIPATTNPAFNGQAQAGYTSDFRYTLNPEVQYDIAKTVLIGAGYKYDQSFNNQPNSIGGGYSDGNSTIYARLGYLF